MDKSLIAKQLRDAADALEAEHTTSTGTNQILDAINGEAAAAACRKLVDVLLFIDGLASKGWVQVGSDAFEEAAVEFAEQHDYVHKDSDEFEDLAHEWADDNGLYDIKDFAFEDLADKFDNGEVRDFVVDYITQNL